MNQIDEAKNEEVDVECKRPSKTTKYTRNEAVKIVIIYMFANIITGKISFLKTHETLKALINSGIFIVLCARLLSRMLIFYYSELLEINQIDKRDFQANKDKYLLLHKSGHVEKFSVAKCLIGDLKKLFPLFIVWAYILISDGNYSISNVFFITVLMMPFVSIWYGYKGWINDGALKLMGINREDMKDIED